MKKIIISFLCVICFLMTNLSTVTAYAITVEDETDDRLNESIFEVGTFREENEARYCLFIYHDAQEFSWMTDFLNKEDTYFSGYLYVKDLENGNIICLVDESIKCYGKTSDRVYYVTLNNEIWYTDLSNSIQSRVFSADLNVEQLLCSDSSIYFLVGNTILRMGIDGDNVESLLTFDSLATFMPISDKRIALVTNDKRFYVHNLINNESTEFDNYDAMFENQWNTGGQRAIIENSTSVSLPLDEYPVGSFFNDFQISRCTCHKYGSNNTCNLNGSCDCKYYHGGIQCLAFAFYAYDRYANCYGSGTASNIASNSAHHLVDRYAPVSKVTESEARSFDTGTYLRTGFTGSGSDHSIFIANNDGITITVYQCNIGNYGCQVSTRTYTIAQFCATYYLYDVYKHNWSNYCQYYNSDYHEVNCTRSGCPGYLLIRHRSDCTECAR